VNSEEAKQILLLYRPAVDRDDPDFTQAIALAKADPELDTWFQQHCAFQNGVSSAFKSIAVPEGLKEQILSERKAHLTLTSRRRALVAACAVVVIAFCGVLTYRSISPPKPILDYSFANFQTNMIGKILRYPDMDIVTNDVQAIRSDLAKRGQSDLVFTPGVDKIVGMTKIAGTGGKALEWQDKPVAMICLNSGKNGKPKTPDLFLFVVDKASIQSPPGATPVVTQIKRGVVSGSWTSGDKTYILAGLGDENFLKQYF
jgi:uncharacterized membrane protein YbaN (DUF454 family)